MANVRRIRVVSTGAVAGLWLASMTGDPAHAENPETSSGGAIGLGNRGWSAAEVNRATPLKDRAPAEFEFSARAGFVSDYVYRGTTLSAHQPAAGAAFEAEFNQLYAGTRWPLVRSNDRCKGVFRLELI